MATRRGREATPQNDAQGREVWCFIKDENDPSRDNFVTVRPGTEKYELVSNTPGWFQVDPETRQAAEDARKAAVSDRNQARADEEAILNARTYATMPADPEAGSRRRGRPSNAEKAAVAEAAALKEENASLLERLAALEAKVAGAENDKDSQDS